MLKLRQAPTCGEGVHRVIFTCQVGENVALELMHVVSGFSCSPCSKKFHDQTGMVYFGGATHCLMFRKGVDVQSFPGSAREENMPVRSHLATVESSK